MKATKPNEAATFLIMPRPIGLSPPNYLCERSSIFVFFRIMFSLAGPPSVEYNESEGHVDFLITCYIHTVFFSTVAFMDALNLEIETQNVLHTVTLHLSW